MSRFGTWRPLPYSPVPYRGGWPKGVVHKTQTVPTLNYGALYRPSGSPPQWTVGPVEVAQHFDSNVGGRALANRWGGVETNSWNARQVEIQGFSGTQMDDATFNNAVALFKHLRDVDGVPWEWPCGRPRPAAPGPRDAGGHNRNVDAWIHGTGWWDHGSVPENTHWDPAFTDWEWFMLNAAMAPAAVDYILKTWKVQPVFNPPVNDVVDFLPYGTGGWVLTSEGAIITKGDAPYLGGAFEKPYFIGRVAATLAATNRGYVITATSGETYHFPE